MHSDLELRTVVRSSYLFINFLPLRGQCEVRFDYPQEFKEVLRQRCLNKRNRVRVWSEIGYEILH